MNVSSLVLKLADWRSKHSLTKYFLLTILLTTITIAYSNPILVQAASSTQSKQIGGNETITGAFGIKLGEDIVSCMKTNFQQKGKKIVTEPKGRYASFSRYVPELESLRGNLFRYIYLEPPVNLKEIFPDTNWVDLLGLRDDGNRVIALLLQANLTGDCEQSVSANAVKELLKGKYKITKPQQLSIWREEYGDGEGNNIRASCSGRSLEINYTSNLLSEYIARLKAGQQKQQDEIKKSLLKKGSM